MQKINEIVFYTLEKCIKTYRQFAQIQLNKQGFDITIDQWLILKLYSENPELTQTEMAEMVFKDKASVTRIIDLLIKKGFIKKIKHTKDQRRGQLVITSKGDEILEKVQAIVIKNRKSALEGIDEMSATSIQHLLTKIISNCSPGK